MTPGQRAYEAHLLQATCERWPDWPDLDASVKETWEYAAIGARLALKNEVAQVRDNGALRSGHIVATDPQIQVLLTQ